ncbi:enoyl-CoA hydratase/isomerase family protein [Gordonia sp. NPDC003376]
MNQVEARVRDGVGTIQLNRPEQMNAITVELGTALERAIADLGADPAVTVIAIRGSGGNFCAGGDFGEVEQLRADGPAGLRALFENFSRACRAIAVCPVPVVAVVEGVAMAGGFELMQAADLCLVRDDARIADNHIRFGQIPGGGSSQRLPRLVGRQQALGLLLSGRRLSGLDAVDLGLAYASWPEETFDAEVGSFLATLAGRRRDAVVGIKRLVQQGLSTGLDRGLDLEIDAVVDHIGGVAGADGVDAFSARR